MVENTERRKYKGKERGNYERKMQKLEDENREEKYLRRGRKGNFFLLFEITSCETDWSSASNTAGICNGKPKVNIIPESFSQQRGITWDMG